MLGRAAQPQPTQTPLWLLAWWDTFGRSGGRELRVVVVEDAAGEVVGILPLLRRWVMRGGVIPVATLELLGTGEQTATRCLASDGLHLIPACLREADEQLLGDLGRA